MTSSEKRDGVPNAGDVQWPDGTRVSNWSLATRSVPGRRERA
jgi:hypothetical protein